MEFVGGSVTHVSERVIALSESNNLILEAVFRRLNFLLLILCEETTIEQKQRVQRSNIFEVNQLIGLQKAKKFSGLWTVTVFPLLTCVSASLMKDVSSPCTLVNYVYRNPTSLEQHVRYCCCLWKKPVNSLIVFAFLQVGSVQGDRALAVPQVSPRCLLIPVAAAGLK